MTKKTKTKTCMLALSLVFIASFLVVFALNADYSAASEPINGKCGSSLNSCLSGTYGHVSDTSTHYKWKCKGINGGWSSSCSKAKSTPQPEVNGRCGSSLNSCTSGSFRNAVDTSTHYKWTCVGSNGGSSASCSKAKSTPQPEVNGRCGSSLNSCTSGSFRNAVDTSTHYKWTCVGSNGGSSASCSKAKSTPQPEVNGRCGSSVNSCTRGTFRDVSDTNTHYKWTCVGSNGGLDASCSKSKPVNGGCGSSLNSCTSGSFRNAVDTSTHYKWTCVGSNGGLDASCSKAKSTPQPEVNGRCGSSLNSCRSGTFRNAVDTSTHYKWTCVGSNGGLDASCSKAKPAPQPEVNGRCGSSLNSCSSGTFRNAADTSCDYKWTCVGSNGGLDASCSKKKATCSTTVVARCGSSLNSCLEGNFSNLPDSSTHYRWRCNGDLSVTCSIARPVNGGCGSSLNSCTSGDFRNAVDTNTHYKWTCAGRNGGSDASCSKAKPAPQPEVNGRCGSSLNSCSSGTFRNAADTSCDYKWTCVGSNGGLDASCSKKKATCSTTVVARCGSSLNSCLEGNFSNLPDSSTHYRWRCNGDLSVTCSKPIPAEPSCGTSVDSCSSGTFTQSADTPTHYVWNCGNDEKTITCRAPKPVIGKCGTSLDSCSSGTFVQMQDSSNQYIWKCMGSNGGDSQTCYKDKTPSVNGSCGSAVNSCLAGTFRDLTDTTNSLLWECRGIRGGTTDTCSIAKTHGRCGTARNTCVSGTPSDGSYADTSSEYRWSCRGQNGGRDSGMCTASKDDGGPSPVNGRCGSSLNSCTRGTFRDVSDTSTHYKWVCDGRNGGSDASCSEAKSTPPSEVDGRCGSSLNSCTRGTFRDVSDTSTHYKWACDGRNGGSSASCSKAKSTPPPVVDGRCGSSLNSCTRGTFRDVSDTSTHYKWACDGRNGGSSASCSKAKSTPPPVVDGRCGSSLNSCTRGTFRDVSDTSTHYKWACDGRNGGSSASCSKAKSTPPPVVDGRCGSSLNSCTRGTFRDVSDTSTHYKWACDGRNGGSSASCSKAKSTPPPVVDGRCGSSLNSCTRGTFRDVSDTSTHYKWACDGRNGGSSASCSKAKSTPPPVVDGRCGSSLNSCTRGTFRDVSDTSTHHKWRCAGSNGGSSASCSKAKSITQPGPDPKIGTCGSTVNSCARGIFVNLEDTSTSHRWGCVSGGWRTTCVMPILKEQMTEEDLSLRTVITPTCMSPGQSDFVYLLVGNEGSGKVKDVRVSASLPELDQMFSSSRLTVPSGRYASAVLTIDMPAYSEIGEYLMIVEASSRERTIVSHRMLEVREVCY